VSILAPGGFRSTLEPLYFTEVHEGGNLSPTGIRRNNVNVISRKQLLDRWLPRPHDSRLASRGVSRLSQLPTLRRFSIEAPSLPTPWDGLKIAQISDVHAGPFMSVARMRRIRDLVCSLSADMIVFTGDQLDRRASDAGRFIEGFQGLHAPLGVYGILGNHDYTAGPRVALRALESAGIEPLVNRARLFSRAGFELALVGVDDLLAEPDFAVLSHYPGAFRVCLCHQPRGWQEARHAGAHLTLSGHTHGGQIVLTRRNLNAARFHTRYIAGPYRRHDAFLYVSRGVGVGAVPLRLGAPPEIDLICLTRREALKVAA
jgi:predicted MPP superfamily phosphohydrolase